MTIWTVERLGRKGDGVALAEGARALAALTLPGEVIEGEAEDGRLAAPRIVTPSDTRVRPPCQHYRACGGCTLMHGSDAFVRDWKVGVVTEALRAQGLAAPIAGVHVSPPRSRRRAVLSGRRTKKGALLGFHARASEIIVDIADCHVLRPAIQSALPLLRRIVIAGASRAGELSLAVTETAAGLDVAVSGGKPMDPALLEALAALAAEGDLARLAWGDEAIIRRPPAIPFGRAQVVPPPAAFLQATAEGEAALVAATRDITKGAGRILDLFAGCGTFTLPLAETAEIHAVEGLAAPLRALEAGAKHATGLRRITTEIRDLARRPLLPDELAYDAIVIDPPRAGAEAQARQIALSSVPKIAWISCDPVSFARDARILAEKNFAIARLYIVDQFRWSPHVETVAEFRRS
ncbi:MAG TPA: class I SAM-dependent RNA methyltransferase [Paracoccus sp. (in: a-proteobacteria)]|uniref:class I SAM-dependent RNA methyltransferase n=1 Tax=Paracoccus sp. TaxID=267 RepID=UPI002B6CC603|nr:class I SAM-dependent RNA methyltransferase [Paracoccus sp. (in: a-proteobacteria)]HWL57843.1 class I SAM-dependent RNA methyltransferase [Paracoccus sp. (in: a-proteobacteria)]